MEYFKAMKKNETYLYIVHVYVFSRTCLFETSWTVTHQAPLSMGSPARILKWVAMPSLQGIFATQESNPHLLCLLHWQVGTKNGELILNKVIKLYVIM